MAVRKVKRLINGLFVLDGVLLAGEGVFSFVAGAHIPPAELLAQVILSAALIMIGFKRMIEL